MPVRITIEADVQRKVELSVGEVEIRIVPMRVTKSGLPFRPLDAFGKRSQVKPVTERSSAVDVERGIAVPPRPSTAEERDRFWPTSEDVGQHDHWKKTLNLVLWRFARGHKLAIPRSEFGMGTNTDMPILLPPLLPAPGDLCQALKRLGYVRMALSALGYANLPGAEEGPRVPLSGGAWDLTDAELERYGPVAPLDGLIDVLELIRDFYDAHQQAVDVGIEQQIAQHALAVADWKSLLPPPPPPTEADLRALLDLGDYDRPDLADCPHLRPLHIPTPAYRGAP